MFFDHLYDKMTGLSTQINAIKFVGPAKFSNFRNVGIPHSKEQNYALIINKGGRYGFYDFGYNEKERKLLLEVIKHNEDNIDVVIYGSTFDEPGLKQTKMVDC
jgi:hypothetical protein